MTECARCRCDYSVSEGCEPDKHCSRCVYDARDELEERLAALFAMSALAREELRVLAKDADSLAILEALSREVDECSIFVMALAAEEDGS